MIGVGGNGVFRKFAVRDLDLTARADAAPAADGIEIDAEFSRRLEHGDAVVELAALAGRGEDDEGILFSHIRTIKHANLPKRQICDIFQYGH